MKEIGKYIAIAFTLLTMMAAMIGCQSKDGNTSSGGAGSSISSMISSEISSLE